MVYLRVESRPHLGCVEFGWAQWLGSARSTRSLASTTLWLGSARVRSGSAHIALGAANLSVALDWRGFGSTWADLSEFGLGSRKQGLCSCWARRLWVGVDRFWRGLGQARPQARKGPRATSARGRAHRTASEGDTPHYALPRREESWRGPAWRRLYTRPPAPPQTGQRRRPRALPGRSWLWSRSPAGRCQAARRPVRVCRLGGGRRMATAGGDRVGARVCAREGCVGCVRSQLGPFPWRPQSRFCLRV